MLSRVKLTVLVEICTYCIYVHVNILCDLNIGRMKLLIHAVKSNNKPLKTDADTWKNKMTKNLSTRWKHIRGVCKL